MTRRWTIPLPPESMLSLNSREHYHAKARKAKALREAAGWGARAVKVPPSERLHLTLHYQPRDRRRRDSDNLMATFKPVADGIRDVALKDDTPAHLSWSEPVIHPPNDERTVALWLVVEQPA